MDKKVLEKLFRNMGYSYQSLIDNEIISSDAKLLEVPDGDAYEIKLSTGFYIILAGELKRFEAIYIILDATSGENFKYQRNLPEPICFVSNKEDVRRALGPPIPAASELDLLETDLYGNDTYQLNVRLHPEALLDFQYDISNNIKNISISLMDSDF